MPPLFSNKRLIVLLVSIILLVALVGYSMRDQRDLTWPEQFIVDTVGWVQSIFVRPAHHVAGFFEQVQEIRSVYEENKILKTHLDEYAQLAVEVNILRKQNKELKNALDIQESLFDYTFKPALVYSRSPDRWNEYIRVNKGEEHGIRKNMAVITPSKGLIGKVQHVSKFSSTVQLLTDHDRTNRISARIGDSGEITGFIEGFDDQTGTLLLRRVSTDAEIEVGQTVITSGLGGVFPQGLLIGEVVHVEFDEYGLTKNAYVKPSADFNQLDYVLIVERDAITTEDEGED